MCLHDALICVLLLFLFVSGIGCVLWLWHSLDFPISILGILGIRDIVNKISADCLELGS